MKQRLTAIVLVVLGITSAVFAKDKEDHYIMAETSIDGAKQPSTMMPIGSNASISSMREMVFPKTTVNYGTLVQIKLIKASNTAQVTCIVSEKPTRNSKSGAISQASMTTILHVPINDVDKKIDLGSGRFVKVKLYLVDSTGMKK
jgi:hypothetical protein